MVCPRNGGDHSKRAQRSLDLPSPACISAGAPKRILSSAAVELAALKYYSC